jgi:hypothetical protein
VRLSELWDKSLVVRAKLMKIGEECVAFASLEKTCHKHMRSNWASKMEIIVDCTVRVLLPAILMLE